MSLNSILLHSGFICALHVFRLFYCPQESWLLTSINILTWFKDPACVADCNEMSRLHVNGKNIQNISFRFTEREKKRGPKTYAPRPNSEWLCRVCLASRVNNFGFCISWIIRMIIQWKILLVHGLEKLRIRCWLPMFFGRAINKWFFVCFSFIESIKIFKWVTTQNSQ